MLELERLDEVGRLLSVLPHNFAESLLHRCDEDIVDEDLQEAANLRVVLAFKLLQHLAIDLLDVRSIGEVKHLG